MATSPQPPFGFVAHLDQPDLLASTAVYRVGRGDERALPYCFDEVGVVVDTNRARHTLLECPHGCRHRSRELDQPGVYAPVDDAVRLEMLGPDLDPCDAPVRRDLVEDHTQRPIEPAVDVHAVHPGTVAQADRRPARTTIPAVIHEDALAAVGNTPLIRLSRFHSPGNLVAKIEYLNPAGSVKERIAVHMIDRAEEQGLLRPEGTIIEPTSGNTGAGLAMVGAVRGYRVICTVPDKVSAEKIALLRAYGAEVHVTPTDLLPDHPDSYYGIARRLTDEIEGAFNPNQYVNQFNPEAHYLTTGPELWDQTEGAIDVFVAGVGTGGTISGAGRYLKEQKPSVEIVGADPEGSIFTAETPEEIHQYRVEGVGEDFYPETLSRELIDRYIKVTDQESFDATRRLAREEGLLVGGSCGLAAHVALQVADEDHGKLVVVLLPDSGRGYLSKIWNDEWMAEHGFH